MEDNRKIKVGIAHGEINGIGYEVILKTFSEPLMLDLCTPIIYGSPKIAAYYRKALELPANFGIVASASEASHNRLNIVNCVEDEVKVECSKPTQKTGMAALQALETAVAEYEAGLLDVLVAAPMSMNLLQSDEFHFRAHSEYVEERLSRKGDALTILLGEGLRIALATEHIPLREVASSLSIDLLKSKLLAFQKSLQYDFGINAPRIAVLSLNPHAGEGGLMGKEEEEIICPAIRQMMNEGMQCFGPYPADGLIGSGNYALFDGILALYHDQGFLPLKALSESGVVYTAGLPVVLTSPAHGIACDIVGQGVAREDSFRQAVYDAIDVYRSRIREKQIRVNPLQKQYYEKKDDSDKLKLDTVDDDV